MSEISVPSFSTQCSLTVTSLENATQQYTSLYKEMPITVFYPREFATKALELRYHHRSGIYDCLHYWVCVPGLPENCWGVAGPQGIFLAWGF